MSIILGVIFWAVLAIAVAFVMVVIAARQARRLLPPVVLEPGESMPTAPLQRLARRSLAVTVLLVIAAAGVVIINGADLTWDVDRIRLTVTALLLAALVTSALVSMRAGLWGMRGSDRIDERDRAILSSATAGQAGAILVTLAVWMIALVERFHDAGQVPSVFLYMIFWSSLLVSQLAWLLGVVMGYRRI